MEKVKVVKAIPGLLEVGDILISPDAGCDFSLDETKITKDGSSERYISIDYVTVSENVPVFFEFQELENSIEEVIIKEDKPLDIIRSKSEIQERYKFFTERNKEAETQAQGSEANVVYTNLLWFIEWLYGKKQLM